MANVTTINSDLEIPQKPASAPEPESARALLGHIIKRYNDGWFMAFLTAAIFGTLAALHFMGQRDEFPQEFDLEFAKRVVLGLAFVGGVLGWLLGPWLRVRQAAHSAQEDILRFLKNGDVIEREEWEEAFSTIEEFDPSWRYRRLARKLLQKAKIR